MFFELEFQHSAHKTRPTLQLFFSGYLCILLYTIEVNCIQHYLLIGLGRAINPRAREHSTIGALEGIRKRKGGLAVTEWIGERKNMRIYKRKQIPLEYKIHMSKISLDL